MSWFPNLHCPSLLRKEILPICLKFRQRKSNFCRYICCLLYQLFWCDKTASYRLSLVPLLYRLLDNPKIQRWTLWILIVDGCYTVIKNTYCVFPHVNSVITVSIAITTSTASKCSATPTRSTSISSADTSSTSASSPRTICHSAHSSTFHELLVFFVTATSSSNSRATTATSSAYSTTTSPVPSPLVSCERLVTTTFQVFLLPFQISLIWLVTPSSFPVFDYSSLSLQK